MLILHGTKFFRWLTDSAKRFSLISYNCISVYVSKIIIWRTCIFSNYLSICCFRLCSSYKLVLVKIVAVLECTSVSDYLVTFPDCNSHHHSQVERSKILEHQEFVKSCGVPSIYTKGSPSLSFI